MYEHRNSFLYGYPAWVNASHMDDLYSVLGEAYMVFLKAVYFQQDYDEVDRQVMQHITNFYVNFAHTGYAITELSYLPLSYMYWEIITFELVNSKYKNVT